MRPARSFASLFIVLSWTIVAACSSGDDIGLGRDGALNRSHQFSDANFSIVLPSGWRIAENWNDLRGGGDIVTGFIGGPDNQQIYYSLFGDSFDSAELLESLPPHPSATDAVKAGFYLPIEASVVSEEVIAGVAVRFSRPAPDLEARYAGIFSAYFETIPDAPAGAAGVGLVFRALGHQVKNDDAATEILRSVRWAVLPAKPPSSIAVTPGMDWITQIIEPPGARGPVFTVMTPPDWALIGRGGTDALHGDFNAPGFNVAFEVGNLGTSGIVPYDVATKPETYDDHLFWEEEINGVMTMFHRPSPGVPVARGWTGAFFPVIPGAEDKRLPNSNREDRGLGIWVEGLTFDRQETMLAVVRTIRHVE
ncbi:MAG: hypothetical protein O3C10_00070 [Chloroflexi bacterium]|nr:hypothetical protein [Chloroflexota bacterium]